MGLGKVVCRETGGTSESVLVRGMRELTRTTVRDAAGLLLCPALVWYLVSIGWRSCGAVGAVAERVDGIMNERFTEDDSDTLDVR